MFHKIAKKKHKKSKIVISWHLLHLLNVSPTKKRFPSLPLQKTHISPLLVIAIKFKFENTEKALLKTLLCQTTNLEN